VFTNRAIPALHEDHFCRWPNKTFCNGLWDRGMKQAPTSWRQENTKRSTQADPRMEVAKCNSRDSSQDTEDMWHGIMTEAAPFQKKGETIDGLRAGAVGALTTRGMFWFHRQEEEMATSLKLFGTSSLKKAGLHGPLCGNLWVNTFQRRRVRTQQSNTFMETMFSVRFVPML
jgi:hypothetical protein